MYDRAAFLARLMGDESIAYKVEKSFLGNLPTQIVQLREYVVQGDLKLAGEMAHKIKGAAATVSAEALHETLARLELVANAGDAATLQSLLPELEEQVRRVQKAMGG